MDEMAQAHAEDMRRDGRLRDLRDELEWFRGSLQGPRRLEVTAALAVVDEERSQIVRRWD